MKTIQSLCLMKYESTIIIYKENKHMNVSYNGKITMKKCSFNGFRDTKRSLFWLLTQETRNFENHVQNNKLSLSGKLIMTHDPQFTHHQDTGE